MEHAETQLNRIKKKFFSESSCPIHQMKYTTSIEMAFHFNTVNLEATAFGKRYLPKELSIQIC